MSKHFAKCTNNFQSKENIVEKRIEEKIECDNQEFSEDSITKSVNSQLNNQNVSELESNITQAPKTDCSNIKTVEVNNRNILIMMCSYCGEKFDSKSKLSEHSYTVHKKIMLFSCDKCGFIPRNNQQMSNHFAKCTNIQSKENHVEKNIAVKTIECDNQDLSEDSIPKSSVNYQLLNKMASEHVDSEHICVLCNTKFTLKRNLERHMMLRHETDPSKKNRFTCPNCQKSYTLKQTLTRHMENSIGCQNKENITPKRYALKNFYQGNPQENSANETQVISKENNLNFENLGEPFGSPGCPAPSSLSESKLNSNMKNTGIQIIKLKSNVPQNSLVGFSNVKTFKIQIPNNQSLNDQFVKSASPQIIFAKKRTNPEEISPIQSKRKQIHNNSVNPQIIFMKKSTNPQEISPVQSNRKQIRLEKPEMSFPQLVSEALVNSPYNMLPLQDIYKSIINRHPYYNWDNYPDYDKWQNQVRYTLTMCKKFVKAYDKFGVRCWTFTEKLSDQTEAKLKSNTNPKHYRIMRPKNLQTISTMKSNNAAEVGPIQLNRKQIYIEKPEMSYQQLISEALNNSQNKMMPLQDIYTSICIRHPYYNLDNQQWQNSVRQTLHTNKNFLKANDTKYWTFAEKLSNSPEANLKSKNNTENDQIMRSLNHNIIFAKRNTDTKEIIPIQSKRNEIYSEKAVVNSPNNRLLSIPKFTSKINTEIYHLNGEIISTKKSTNIKEISPIESKRKHIHSEKPEMSYPKIISEALLNLPNNRLTLKDIYNSIRNRYPDYNFDNEKLQNLIRETMHGNAEEIGRIESNTG